MAEDTPLAGSPPKSLKPSLGLDELLRQDGGPPEERKIVKVEPADLKERQKLREENARLRASLEKLEKKQSDALGMFETMERAKARFESVPVSAPAEPEPEPADGPREEPMDAESEAEPNGPQHHTDGSAFARAAPVLARMPALLFKSDGQMGSFPWLRNFIREFWNKCEEVDRRRPLQILTAWYGMPGAAMEHATPIDIKRELIVRPFKDGIYYIRVRRQPDMDSPNDRFYIAHVHTRAENEQVANTKLGANMIALRTLEDHAIRLKESMDRERAQADDNARLREDINNTREDLAASERHCIALQAEIELLKAAGEPLMSNTSADDLGVKAIERFAKIMEDPSGKARAEFDRLRDFNRRLYEVIKMLFQGLFERPEFLRVFLEDAPELFDAVVQHVNVLSKEAEQDILYLPSGELMERLKPMLPPHEEVGSDDRMLALLTEADRKIEQLQAELATEREANEALVGEEEEEAEEEERPAPRRAPARRHANGAAKKGHAHHANGRAKESGRAAPKTAKKSARAKAPPKSPPKKPAARARRH